MTAFGRAGLDETIYTPANDQSGSQDHGRKGPSVLQMEQSSMANCRHRPVEHEKRHVRDWSLDPSHLPHENSMLSDLLPHDTRYITY